MLPHRNQRFSAFTIVALILGSVVAVMWLALPTNTVRVLVLTSGLCAAFALAVAGAFQTKTHGRCRMGIATLAIVMICSAMVILVAPALGPLVTILQPDSKATIERAEAQKVLDAELHRLGVRHVSVHVIRAEERRGVDVNSYYLCRVNPEDAAGLKDALLSGVHAMGWVEVDDADTPIRSMPYPNQPKWFDPKLYEATDYLSLGSDHAFAFSGKTGRVLFSWTTD